MVSKSSETMFCRHTLLKITFGKPTTIPTQMDLYPDIGLFKNEREFCALANFWRSFDTTPRTIPLRSIKIKHEGRLIIFDSLFIINLKFINYIVVFKIPNGLAGV